MNQDQVQPPSGWAEALARSDAQIARGELVTAEAVHDEVRAALAEMAADVADTGVPTSRASPAR
jgi:hypothetical protein